MSWSIPQPDYNPNSDAVFPGIVKSTPALSFADVKTKVKFRPIANGGGDIGPLSTFEIAIPAHPTGFLVPNSMYLHFGVEILVNANITVWAFAGQADPATAAGITNYNDPSPASSVLERIEIVFPNGQQMTYNAYDLYSWSVTCSHTLPREYVRNDLKELMHCHTSRTAAAGPPGGTTSRISLPLDLPIFASTSAFPLCLLNGPIVIRFFTNDGGRAFHGGSNANFIGYRMFDIGLMYEQLETDVAWKQNFIERVRVNPFIIPVKDRHYVGQSSGVVTTRINVGANLSSLNAVLVSTIQPYTTFAARKCAVSSGLVRWNLEIDNQRVNEFELDDAGVCFAELNRALGVFRNPAVASNLSDIQSNANDARRTTYSAGQFLLGLSTRIYNDQLYTLTGQPARNLSIYIERSAVTDVTKFPRNAITANSQSHVFLLHDTICMIDGEGNVILRR